MIRPSAINTNDDRGTVEESLWRAVILGTIDEWLTGPLRRRREAEKYLFGDGVDFVLVCQSAGMDAERLREKLKKLRDEKTRAAEASTTNQH